MYVKSASEPLSTKAASGASSQSCRSALAVWSAKATRNRRPGSAAVSTSAAGQAYSGAAGRAFSTKITPPTTVIVSTLSKSGVPAVSRRAVCSKVSSRVLPPTAVIPIFRKAFFSNSMRVSPAAAENDSTVERARSPTVRMAESAGLCRQNGRLLSVCGHHRAVRRNGTSSPSASRVPMRSSASTA